MWNPAAPGSRPGPPPPQPAAPEPQVVELDAAQVARLDELRASLPGGFAPREPSEVGVLYDGLLDAWLRAPVADVGDAFGTIDVIGVALGDVVRAKVPGARWAAVVDEHGTELAIVTSSSATGPTMFPMAAVTKRWLAEERGWAAEYIEWIVEQYAQVAQHAQAAEEPSVPAQELALFALNHAVDSIVPEGGPLVPFCLVETAEGRELHRFAGELGQALADARNFARGSGAVRAAVAWDGYLTVDGRRGDALFVEASDVGAPSIVLARSYEETPHGTRAVGEPMLVDRGGPVL